MRVLSVDPGYDRCGVALLEKQHGKEVVLHAECIETSRSSPFDERFLFVGVRLEKLFTKYHPDSCALETLYISANQKTGMAVAEVRGMVRYLALRHGVQIYEYTPLQVKVAIAGDGRADKRRVLGMVKRLVQVPHENALDDEFDAIAIGLTALASVRIRS